MKSFRLLGALVAAVALLAGSSVMGTGTVSAQPEDGIGIQASAAPSAAVGGNIQVLIEFVDPGAPFDPHFGFNASLVYDPALVSWVSFTNQSEASGVYNPGSTFCPAPLFDDNIGGLLGTLNATVLGCATLAGHNTSNTGAVALATFTADAVGFAPFHMMSEGAPDNAGGTYGTYTLASDSSAQLNQLFCGGAICGAPPPGNTWTVVVQIVDDPPTLTVSKTGAATAIAGTPYNFDVVVTNPDPTTATNVTLADTVPADLVVTGISGPNAGDCSFVGQVVSCGPISLAQGETLEITIETLIDGNATGNRTNEACAEWDDALNLPTQRSTACDSHTVNILAPAVAWEKSEEIFQVFVTDGSETVTFQEIMINQGDPNGLGGFEFTILYDNQILHPPVIDLSPAIALFAAAGRTLDCTMTVQLETRVHVACVSTGTFGVGPVWVGAEVIAEVTFETRLVVNNFLRPMKNNGIVTWVKDVHVEAVNTCGMPLNDGSQDPIGDDGDKCQGELLQGILPGGLIENSDSEVVITLRRLEGDVTKSCDVDVADLQAMASRYGYSFGSLLYNVWYDLEPYITNGDGDIDVKDLQMVYGRFGSTCANPIPAQNPHQLP
jgi:hypothetical protein